MPNPSDRFFVLTGGPGAGKTTLVEALGRAGFATTTEAGRAIIRDQLDIGGPATHQNNPALFAELMLAFDMQSTDAFWMSRVRSFSIAESPSSPDITG